jgi:SAM-dependent methyltransferase
VDSSVSNVEKGVIDAADRSGKQQHFYEEECDPEFEIVRPHQCGRIYSFLIDYKFRLGLALLRQNLKDASMLEICCGSGMLTEKFAAIGADVLATDFSAAAVARAEERARRYHFKARFAVADAQKLEWDDHSFDFAYVHDGLHHLEDPYAAIGEMARVVRKGMLIMDPAKAAITSLAVKLGLAEDVEDAGKEVKRLDAKGVERFLRDRGFSQVKWCRTLMYYQHRPFGWFKWFEHEPLFQLFRFSFELSNTAIGKLGNKLTLVALR